MSTESDIQTVKDLYALGAEIDAFVAEGGLKTEKKEKVKSFAVRARAIANAIGETPVCKSVGCGMTSEVKPE